MKKIKILLVTCVISSNLLALTLPKAVELALEKNYGIKIEASKVDAARANKNINNAEFLPLVDLSYTYNKRDETITGQTKEDSTFSAAVSYNLFNGFSSTSKINSASSQYKASKYYFEAKKFDTILDVKQRYINYLNKEKSLQTAKDALKLFKKQYEDSLNKYNEGLLAKNELLQVQVSFLQAKQINVQAKSALDISKKSLSNILGGLDLANEKIEPLKDTETIANFDKSFLEDRSEIKAIKENIKSANSMVTGSRSSYLPTVDASLSYNKFGDDASLNGKTGYPDSQNVLTVAAKWNLFKGGSTESLATVYKNQVSQAKDLLAQTRLDLKLQYDSAISSYEVSKLNLETSAIALEQAKINYKIVNNRFKEGISKTTDLIDANYLLTSSKQNYFSAYYGKFLAKETLNRIVQK